MVSKTGSESKTRSSKVAAIKARLVKKANSRKEAIGVAKKSAKNREVTYPTLFVIRQTDGTETKAGSRRVVEFNEWKGKKFINIAKQYTKRQDPDTWLFGGGVSINLDEQEILQTIYGLVVVARSQGIEVDVDLIGATMRVNNLID